MKGHHNETVIIDKIKKLFALSNSPVEEEAASALNKAKELLVKYDIEYEKIEEAKENVIERIVLKSRDIIDWQYKLIECITNSTFTEAIVETEEKNKTVIIIGRKINVIAAVNLYDYLENKYGKITKRKYDNTVDENSYGLGKIIGGKISLNDQIEKE